MSLAAVLIGLFVLTYGALAVARPAPRVADS